MEENITNAAPQVPDPQPQPVAPAAAPAAAPVAAPAKKKNGMGITGFIFALLGLIFCWVPILGWILWALGLIFSFIGLFKKPKGLAITGTILSGIGLVVLIILIVVVGAAAGGLASMF